MMIIYNFSYMSGLMFVVRLIVVSTALLVLWTIATTGTIRLIRIITQESEKIEQVAMVMIQVLIVISFIFALRFVFVSWSVIDAKHHIKHGFDGVVLDYRFGPDNIQPDISDMCRSDICGSGSILRAVTVNDLSYFNENFVALWPPYETAFSAELTLNRCCVGHPFYQVEIEGTVRDYKKFLEVSTRTGCLKQILSYYVPLTGMEVDPAEIVECMLMTSTVAENDTSQSIEARMRKTLEENGFYVESITVQPQDLPDLID